MAEDGHNKQAYIRTRQREAADKAYHRGEGTKYRDTDRGKGRNVARRSPTHRGSGEGENGAKQPQPATAMSSRGARREMGGADRRIRTRTHTQERTEREKRWIQTCSCEEHGDVSMRCGARHTTYTARAVDRRRRGKQDPMRTGIVCSYQETNSRSTAQQR